MKFRTFSALGALLGGFAIALVARDANGQGLSTNQLVAALRQGGYVLVMRHASSPREAPNKDTANADNTKLERQLDEAGRAGATGMGTVSDGETVVLRPDGKGGMTLAGRIKIEEWARLR